MKYKQWIEFSKEAIIVKKKFSKRTNSIYCQVNYKEYELVFRISDHYRKDSKIHTVIDLNAKRLKKGQIKEIAFELYCEIIKSPLK